MNTGKVKFFNDAKGFGFITDEQGNDVFVHYSDIISDGFKTLVEDQEVIFELYEDSTGKRRAKNVVKKERL
mgnify:CR=1 FL=1